MSLWDTLQSIWNEKLYVLAPVGMVVSFVAMVWLNLSPWSDFHYIPETVEMFFAGCVCGLMARNNEEFFAPSMMLPAAVNYVLKALLIPITMLLTVCFYAGLYFGGKNNE